MATFLAGKITQLGWWSKDTENTVLHNLDATQSIAAVVIKYSFIPGIILVSAYKEGVPLHAYLNPIPS
jgi:hypothetical protein